MSETKTLQERLRDIVKTCAKPRDSGWSDDLLIYDTAVATEEAADDLDAKDALLREARGELDRMVEHFGTWADDHPTDATTETWGALHCARALLTKLTEATK